MFYKFLYSYKLWIIGLSLLVSGGFYASKKIKEYRYKKHIINYSPLEKCLIEAKADELKIKECL